MKIDFNNNTLIITLYNPEDISIIRETLELVERYLCVQLDIDESCFEEFNEIHIDVNDYNEYLMYRRVIIEHTPYLVRL